MSWKRPLFLFHRWAGIVLCLFFALWFTSGLFMMYVEFPQLAPMERRSGTAPLDFSTARLAPGDVLARLQAGHFQVNGTPSANLSLDIADPAAPVAVVDRVQLGMLLGRPVYRVYVPGAQPRAVFGDTGELLRDLTPEMVTGAAREFAANAGWRGNARYLDLQQTDQWTVSAGLNAHRPLHRIALDDAAGTQLYVSSTTGEVVRDTRRLERGLNYLGAVIHWIYPTVLRRYPDAWEWIVDIFATAGTLLAISGLWVGLLRWRRRREAQASITPYRGMMRWHHLTGLVFGLTAVTWVLSGLLSMNPGNINPSRSPSAVEALVFSGTALTPADFETLSLDAAREVVEAELLHVEGNPFYKLIERSGAVRLVPGRAGSAARVPTVQALLRKSAALMPGVPPPVTSVLTAYDNYYYSRHPEQGTKPLPIIRVQFSDARHTWFYVDPLSGQVLERSTRFNRLYRWLYNGLHSFDIQWLWQRRPLWDITVITFSLGGLALSLIGVAAGVRRLRWELGITPLQPRAARAAARMLHSTPR